MVKIVDFKVNQTEEGNEFCTLIVQGGLEAVKSKQTNKTYFTVRTARVACTFTPDICKSLIGTDFPGTVKKVESEPYEYTVESTGETITLTHRYEYVSEEDAVIESNVVKQEVVF